MIAEIDSQADITAYLQGDDIRYLSDNKIIAGILIRTFSPSEQGIVRIQVDDNKKKLNRCIGIGIDDKKYWGTRNGFEVDVFVGYEFFEMLRERGRIETRQSMRDESKIAICKDLSSMERISIETLEFYCDNRERYAKKD